MDKCRVQILLHVGMANLLLISMHLLVRFVKQLSQGALKRWKKLSVGVDPFGKSTSAISRNKPTSRIRVSVIIIDDSKRRSCS